MTLTALNEQMQEGYKLSLEGELAAACDAWMRLWRGIEWEMEARGIGSIEEFEPIFDGDQYLTKWANDFDIALYNASLEDKAYAKLRADFCTAYLRRIPEDGPDGLNFRKAIAEAYFRLGKAGEGEAAYRALTEDRPTWAWGWIGWAEQYGSYGEEENRDPERGIALLKRALEVDGLEDREFVLERLQDMYEEAGMMEEAEAIQPLLPRRQSDEPIPSIAAKAGRNDPCPCGSGKKYKKCCGAAE
ncbi:MAG TPA: SEC-C metal-binding domain-containing protein [Paenibacillus sp.]|nr:SEC-C metal-binding domain-containing protein [Paenibacillus sp.]HZG88051.1 SEC-C metal-binding domain-containing protein [Paenibacillus sp.]